MSDFLKIAERMIEQVGETLGVPSCFLWQPIETAPKDGTQILAYGKYGWEEDCEKTEEGWAVIFWKKVGSWNGAGWTLVHANPYADRMDPAVWMPLPAPPKEPST